MFEYLHRLPSDKQEVATQGLELLAASGFLPILAEAVLEEVTKSLVAEDPDDQALRRLRIAHGVGVVLTRLHVDATKLREDRLASIAQHRPDYESVL